jgi:MinD superfamily P-loop ATPase
MRIAITGGKGGTGKSTVATALAVELAKKQKILLVDADVDCPNDHIILSLKLKKEKDIFQVKPVWDFKKCVKCGRCSEVCRANAILFVKEKYPIFVQDLCNGCTACTLACPTKAISRGRQQIGTILSGRKYDLDQITGEMRIGYEEASPIVNALKKFISSKEKRYDHTIVDTAAGTHCNVISALIGCDLAIAVTEPTPLGAHDLNLILSLTKVLKVPSFIVLNRSNVGDKMLVKKIADKYKTKIIAEIPYRKEILEQYSKGKPITDENIITIINEINKIKK